MYQKELVCANLIGTDLEQLIKEIERHLLPEDFNVELNERVFNDDGVQIAEFDIVITGRLGSSSIRWLIECRNRPSHGPAPGAWIEQLVGRKARFNFQQVIAVSTTGFAQGVREFAEREGIILRNVKEFTDIGADFRVREFAYIDHQTKVVGPIEVVPADPNDVPDYIQLLLPNIRFKITDADEYQTLHEFVGRQISLYPCNLWNNLKTRFDFRYDGLIDMLVNGKKYQIAKLIIPVEFSTIFYTSKALTVNVYSEDERIIGKEANFNFDLPTGSFSFRVLILSKPNGMEEIRFVIPENIPDSYALRKLHTLAEGNRT